MGGHEQEAREEQVRTCLIYLVSIAGALILGGLGWGLFSLGQHIDSTTLETIGVILMIPAILMIAGFIIGIMSGNIG